MGNLLPIHRRLIYAAAGLLAVNILFALAVVLPLRNEVADAAERLKALEA